MPRSLRQRAAGTAAAALLIAGLAHSTPSVHAAPAPVTTAFVPLSPCRLLDTRDTGAVVAAGSTVVVATNGRCGIPAGTAAVSVTVTVTLAAGSGFVSLWPTDQARPTASVVNFTNGATRANGALVRLAANGSLSAFASAATHVVIDVGGAFVPAARATAGRFVATTAARLLDTRLANGRLAAGGTVNVPLPAGVPPDATAVAVNITTTGLALPGFFAAFPSASARPNASVLNTDAIGQTRAASTIVPVNAGGFSVYSQNGGDVIVDLAGWFTGPSSGESSDGLFVPSTPTRLLDTRGASPLGMKVPLYRDGGVEIPGLPAAAAVAVNVTIDDSRPGWVAGYGAGTERPTVSSINADAIGATVANLAIVRQSTRGIAFYAQAREHLVVDSYGYFTGEPAAAVLAPLRNAVLVENPRVLWVGDSTMSGIRWYAQSKAAVRGHTALLELESCRRLYVPSCRGREGRVPPTATRAVQNASGVLDAVVVQTGYNDWYTNFPASFDALVAAARAKGAQQIIWLTYRTNVTYGVPGFSTGSSSGSYAVMNQVLADRVASGLYDDVVLADWNSYSRNQRSWFAADGVHFSVYGSYGTADYVSRWVAYVGGFPCPAPAVPNGPIADVCPNPDTQPVPDVMAIYGGSYTALHCYEVGEDRHLECRPDKYAKPPV
jgi:hypothetical protein